MSTHKQMDFICIVAIVLAMLVSIGLCFAPAAAATSQGTAMDYETRLFDTSKVHTIDIVMNDWDSFLSTAEQEEYSACSLVIDGETVKNAAIRGKGNTSLSQVSSLHSQRYSFKVEFDHYNDNSTYYGLDKLCLNNIIQDNTYMKDYLSYTLMDNFGVNTPLCSYAYLTVNGEDWGLYLAVEAVEDSFLKRIYGTDTGNLYKPDSMRFGAGRGNGKGFNQDDFMREMENERENAAFSTDSSAESDRKNPFEGQMPPDMPEGAPDHFPSDFSPSDFTPPTDDKQDNKQDSSKPPSFPTNGERPQRGDKGEGFGDFGGKGSDDVKLKYIDDAFDSYSNIFDSAKTAITNADKKRLIASLKQLSDYENLDNVLDMEQVLRYFVVHNFLVNGDSYTGNMIHNYYLHESNGQLSMIPWDYNLAFGTFMGNNATSSVNESIDTQLTDRPMQGWIFSDQTYTAQYHKLYASFVETANIQEEITRVSALIAPYVQKDPTAFCTYEEFQKGVEALKMFCHLRTQSVLQQLTGSQEEVNADSLNLSDMGTMNRGMGQGKNTNANLRGGTNTLLS